MPYTFNTPLETTLLIEIHDFFYEKRQTLRKQPLNITNHAKMVIIMNIM